MYLLLLYFITYFCALLSLPLLKAKSFSLVSKIDNKFCHENIVISNSK